MTKYFLLSAFVFILFSCGTNKKEKTKITIENPKFTNEDISACVSVFVANGIDSAYAKEKAICMYESIQRIDSSFFDIKNDTLITKFINEHRAKLDSICDLKDFDAMLLLHRKAGYCSE